VKRRRIREFGKSGVHGREDVCERKRVFRVPAAVAALGLGAVRTDEFLAGGFFWREALAAGRETVVEDNRKIRPRRVA
jgi:hypothetical protein